MSNKIRKVDRKKLLPTPKGTSRNDITGDFLRTKEPTEKYREGYDKIDWSKK